MGLFGLIGLYVAGVIGAGFASGQELTIFFVNYGWGGLFGVLLAMLLLTLGTALILNFCSRQQVSSYGDIFAVLNPVAGRFFDVVYFLFLLVGISVMLAGTAAMGETTLSSLMFRSLTALLVFVVLVRGAAGVVKLSRYLAPCLVLILGLIAFFQLKEHGIRLPEQGSWRALDAACLYSSYNLGFAMTVLASIHHYVKGAKERKKLAIWGNLILGFCLLLLYFALNTLPQTELQGPFPLGYVAQRLGSSFYLSYQFLLWAAMYSTALANSLALVNRITRVFSGSWQRASVFATATAFGLSYFGFSALIRTAYPLLGLLGLCLFAILLHLSLVRRWLF